jgi:endonuclease/exonuclease/phosphatase family metal-dependent hydrolase
MLVRVGLWHFRGRRAAIGATIRIGEHSMRVYSVHAETRVPMKKKMEQLQAVVDALARWSTIERAVVMGDFNTIKGKDVRACIKLFTERGFTTPIPHNRSTWKTFIIKLKLDWLWLRGVQAIGHSIVRRIGLSDH